MLIVLLGPPGAGKGTQAARLAALLEVPTLSTGELLRQAKASGTELGELVRETLDSGQLVEDEHVVSLVFDHLKSGNCQYGAVLDGFPRTVKQAETLERHLDKSGRSVDLVIELEVPAELVIERLKNRFTESSSPRPEDHPDVVEHRLRLFEQMTAPVAEYYSRRGKLARIDGAGSVDVVFHRVREKLTRRFGNSWISSLSGPAADVDVEIGRSESLARNRSNENPPSSNDRG